MSAGILLKEVKRIAGRSKAIITGDFNMVPESRAYSILTENGSSKSFLTDSYKISETPPEGPVQTFNGWSDVQGERRIDYIFVKRGIKVSSISTITRKDGPVYISDHWPVRAMVNIK
jgi:endonuclease/exonuclease/phosphatase family metal-dependent hydrolase